MRVSVQASISAIQMSANSIKYVTAVFKGHPSHRPRRGRVGVVRNEIARERNTWAAVLKRPNCVTLTAAG